MQDVRLEGVLGAAVDANVTGRIDRFVQDEHSPAIALFDPRQVAVNTTGDWYGEHAGKWLWAASRAAARTTDALLRSRVERVVSHLADRQAADGYLGTYAPARRFMVKQPPAATTWDGAPAQRTWDIWTHTCLVLGLLESHRQLGTAGALETATRIGDLCWQTLRSGEIDVVELGNHHGLSATVLLDAAVELYFATGAARYLELALLIHASAERHPRLGIVRNALAGADASEISTGKAYQLLWNLTALAKLHRATGESNLLDAVCLLAQNIRDHHLTLGGGPYGGVGQRSREVFNPRGFFSPRAYVETCSTMAWILLNRELLQLTGDAVHAQAIERSAYNDLLGAQAENGEDWCYYSFANGRRVHTTFWRCCKSSGAMALEALPELAYGMTAGGAIAVNLLGPSEATVARGDGGTVHLRQRTGYPFAPEVELEITLPTESDLALRVRRPDWATHARIRVNGSLLSPPSIVAGYWSIERRWRSGDVLTVDLPMPIEVRRESQRSVQESLAPDGEAVAQEVLRYDYLALTRGPLVYATGLIEGYKVDDCFRVQTDLARESMQLRESVDAAGGVTVQWTPEGRSPLLFEAYFRVGGRKDGAWRLTWLSTVPVALP